jgi:hypothetical protein
MTQGAETDAVAAFIRERQTAVLAAATSDIAAAPLAELRAVLHAADGTVGSYQLTEAHEAIAMLRAVASNPSSTDADVEAARTSAVAQLRDIAARLDQGRMS